MAGWSSPSSCLSLSGESHSGVILYSAGDFDHHLAVSPLLAGTTAILTGLGNYAPLSLAMLTNRPVDKAPKEVSLLLAYLSQAATRGAFHWLCAWFITLTGAGGAVFSTFNFNLSLASRTDSSGITNPCWNIGCR